ncbi:histidine--tRNA ligase [Flavobacterium sp. RHBU_3]|uniref:histidine--tRNA ligase n=1 Tax=Flavobacterium sp. RHBU_3 TaxID=3391184 RepID=UPI00398465B9
MAKPGIPKGTRDFSPAEVAKRQYIMSVIKRHFELFGFQPIETPSFENSDTLMGKYGEEGDRLIFKVLDSGDYLSKVRDNVNDSTRLVQSYYKILNEINTSKQINIDYDFDNIFHLKLLSIFDNPNSSAYLFMQEYFKENKEQILKDFNSVDNLAVQSYIFSNSFSSFLKKYNEIFLSTKKVTSVISEKALRYDLTVPFARYVVQHQNDITFPFKRYQIQPVWRADKPQKGRYREFYQCDADVVGSTSLWQEVELVQLYDAVFTSLGLAGVTIKINNRKVLGGIAEVIGAKDKLIDFTVALDKLDKIGEAGVKAEMEAKGISAEAIEKVQPLFNFTGTISEKIEQLASLLASSEEGMKGVEELRFICDNVAEIGLGTSFLDLDVTLARGLNYYTGAIFEVAAPEGVKLGSIGGGGRYDDLTGIFDKNSKLSGVGISFGLDRIYLVIEDLGLFPETVTEGTKVLFVNFGDKEALYAQKAVSQLRVAGVKAELYPDAAKIGKQFQHADKRTIPYAVMAGDAEMASGTYTLKNLGTGEQQSVTFDELVAVLNS